MAQIQVYYKNGNYEEFSTTILPFQDGYLLQNDFLKIENIKEEGIIWERSFFTFENEDPKGEGLTIQQFQIVKPETLPKIEMILLNGEQKIYINENEEVITENGKNDQNFEEEIKNDLTETNLKEDFVIS